MLGDGDTNLGAGGRGRISLISSGGSVRGEKGRICQWDRGGSIVGRKSGSVVGHRGGSFRCETADILGEEGWNF